MSIANEIQRISSAKTDLKTAINARGGTLTIHYYDSDDDVCRTAFAGVSNQQHECRRHSCENAWKFISQFTR